MKRLAAAIVLGLVVTACAFAGSKPVRATGVSMRRSIELGAATSIGFRLLRGTTPVSTQPTVVARAGGVTITAPAQALGRGRYRATLRPTGLGRWSITVRAGDRALQLGATTVIRPRLVETYKAIVEPHGMLVLADGGLGGGRLIRVDPHDGRRVVVAGNGGTRFDAIGKEASAAALGRVYSVARSATGDLYAVVDNRIVKIGDGRVRAVAGNGADSSTGDGGPAIRATLSQPIDVEVAPNGDLLVAELGAGRIRRIDATGTISTVTTAVERPFKLAFAHDGSLLVTQLKAGTVFQVGATGQASAFVADVPVVSGIVRLPSGYLFAQHPPEHGARGDLVRLAGDGTRTVLARSAIQEPSSLAAAADGTIYMTAFDPAVPLGRVDPATGEITPIG